MESKHKDDETEASIASTLISLRCASVSPSSVSRPGSMSPKRERPSSSSEESKGPIKKRLRFVPSTTPTATTEDPHPVRVPLEEGSREEPVTSESSEDGGAHSVPMDKSMYTKGGRVSMSGVWVRHKSLRWEQMLSFCGVPQVQIAEAVARMKDHVVMHLVEHDDNVFRFTACQGGVVITTAEHVIGGPPADIGGGSVSEMKWDSKGQVLNLCNRNKSGYEVRTARQLWDENTLILQQTVRKAGSSVSGVIIFKRAVRKPKKEQPQPAEMSKAISKVVAERHINVVAMTPPHRGNEGGNAKQWEDNSISLTLSKKTPAAIQSSNAWEGRWDRPKEMIPQQQRV